MKKIKTKKYIREAASLLIATLLIITSVVVTTSANEKLELDNIGIEKGSGFLQNQHVFKSNEYWIEQANIIASDGEANDEFGNSVSIDGDYAVIGAPRDSNDNGVFAGSAYIFKRNGSDWIEQAKLIASDGQLLDLFGYSVSINGDYTVIGAYGDDDNGFDSGSAYIFKRDGTTWSQQAKILTSDGAQDDHFGNSVSVSGDYVCIGSYWDDNVNGNYAGSAYIFKRDGTTWSQQAKILASDGALNDQFGNSVSINGDYAVIGAFADDDFGTASGSAYVFARSGDNWNEQAKLLASDGDGGDNFGSAVSIHGENAIIGAPYADDNEIASGSAYIFKRNGTNWNEQAKLTASEAAELDKFGTAVSIHGENVIIGTLNDDENGVNSGSVYIFNHDGTTWSQQAKILASNGAEDDQFGNSVSINGDYVCIGSYLDDNDNGIDTGSAYIFHQEPDTTPPVTTAELEGEMQGDDYLYDVTVILTAFDNISSVDYTMIKIDEGVYEEYTQSVVVSTLGEHTVYFYSVDVENNIEDEKSISFNIVGLPEINIGSIVGGNGITVTIENIGDADATNVEWAIDIQNGLIILTSSENGTIASIGPGESEEITMSVFGIGLGIVTTMPKIVVNAGCEEGSSAQADAEARIALFLVTIQ